ncbi:hypothetical protein [Halarcobacter sp.]|uniref:glycosyltransferase n=1 Tax=Halarcobacter sp. TaxID=2321133 RepID=UPI002AA9588F|nr:hypothetical protein [Halarcobacter sp.]
MELDNLKNKRIYLAPYNNLTIELSSQLKEYGIDILGFVDNFKIGKNIYKKENISRFDYIIIDSPKYWNEISNSFDLSKVIVSHNKSLGLILYNDYKKFLISIYKNKYDILFFAYNRSNVIDSSLVSRALIKLGFRVAIIINPSHYDYINVKIGLEENSDIETVSIDAIHFINFEALVCLVDWIDRDIIVQSKEKGIKTIGLVDGIEDFEDKDYKIKRYPYQTTEFVLTCGRNDMKFLQNKKDKCAIVGLPKMFDMWNSPVTFPDEHLVMINVNFTYGTYEEVRELWLEQVIEACNILNLNYIIAQHHADKGELSTFYNVSEDDIYTTIKKSTIVISRFSTIICESLAYGKPVVYHNPHNELVKLYKNPKGAYSISTDTNSLVKMIRYELSNRLNIRQRAKEFLDDQFNILSRKNPIDVAATKIKNIIEKGRI